MGIRLKICADCGHRKMIGRSKSRCKTCRKATPDKFLNKPVGSSPKYKQKKKARLTIMPFENWRICHLPKCVYSHNKNYSTVNLGKKQRDFVLKTYGYKNYAAYLVSELWTSIRKKVLKNSICACGCGKPANQVHHKMYTESNLMGETLHGLVAINHACHYKIEFSEDRKVSLGEANYELKERQHQSVANSNPPTRKEKNMKFVVEPQDIEKVKELAEYYCNVTITDKQAKQLIDKDRYLTMELFEDDVEGETITGCVTDLVFEGHYHEGLKWSWPCYGDGEKYYDEFNIMFKKLAAEKGILLGEVWNSK